MHLYLVFAHPSHQSFTFAVLEAFTRGLSEAQHSFEIGDLYALHFNPVMDLAEYQRESSLALTTPLSPEVQAEQAKLARSQALVFIYPLWWSDCPAILKGWFDRVWAYGYAYLYTAPGEHATSNIPVEKALVLCPAGHPTEYLETIGIAESMRRVMLQDRLVGVCIKQTRLEILGGMVAQDLAIRNQNLERAYRLGLEFEALFVTV